MNGEGERMIEHTIKWDTSPFGPWCWHSFRGEGLAGPGSLPPWEITVEPYLYGDAAEGPWGGYVVKTFVSRLVLPVVSEDLDAVNAMFILWASLQGVAGDPVLVRWVPNVEIIEYERKLVAVMLHLVGGGYVMAMGTYEQLKPRLEAKYGALRETRRPPTEGEKEAHDQVKAALEGGEW